jgi:hypothetical protein
MSGLTPYWQPSPYLLVVGDIGITDTWVVTPRGSCPLRGTRWIVTDRTYYKQATPVWAIVLAAVLVSLFIWVCLLGLLGLLLLLVKEYQLAGSVEVAVSGDEFFYATQVPTRSSFAVFQTHQLAAQAQALATMVR